MTLSESDLTALRNRDTRAATRDGCLSADVLAAAARGELAAGDRGRVADHLAGCSDCAEELRLIQPLQAWSERTAEAYGRAPQVAPAPYSWQWAWQLASLILVVAVGGLLAWNVALRSDNAELMARAVPPAGVIVPGAPPPVSADVNVPIVDLQADTLRSGGAPPVIATVRADATLATLILNSDSRDTAGTFGLDMTDESGRRVWETSALTMTPFNTFTIAVSPARLGAGLFHLQLFRVIGERREPLERYSVRIEPGR